MNPRAFTQKTNHISERGIVLCLGQEICKKVMLENN